MSSLFLQKYKCATLIQTQLSKAAQRASKIAERRSMTAGTVKKYEILVKCQILERQRSELDSRCPPRSGLALVDIA